MAIRVDARAGNADSAFERFEWTLRAADIGDPYPAVWLTLMCGRDLLKLDPVRTRVAVDRFEQVASQLGFPEVSRRFGALVEAAREMAI